MILQINYLEQHFYTSYKTKSLQLLFHQHYTSTQYYDKSPSGQAQKKAS